MRAAIIDKPGEVGPPLDGYPEAIETVRRGEGVKVQVLPQSSAD